MKNGPDRSKKLLLPAFLIYIAAALVGAIGFYACQILLSLNAGLFLAILILLAVLVLAGACAWVTSKKAAQQLDTLVEKGNWYKSVLDSIDFPIHVTDNDMKWTFLNRAFEKLMIDQNNIKDRESAYGRACSNAGANICNTENCGIAQLRKGVGQSYFEWCGMNCKQDTSYLVNEHGERIGFVEVVTDLTSLIRVNKYNATEINRLVGNLNKLAAGDLELDLKIGVSDEFTKDTYKDFSEINHSLGGVKDALTLMINDTDILTKAAV
jgi:methyl-accepting chemotaxis protein